MENDNLDAVDNPLGYECGIWKKPCDAVKRCWLRMHNGDCMLRTALIRILGNERKMQRTLFQIGRMLQAMWRDPARDRMNAQDRRYFDQADRD